MDSADAFDHAFRDLDRRFGNTFVIGERMRDKLDDFPKIGGKDHQSLRRFADYLRQCESCKDSISGLNFLNDPRENRRLLQKCPDWLVQRWRRNVVKCQRESGKFPSFSEFVEFLSEEADIASEPCTSFNEGKQKQEFSDVKKRDSTSDKSFKKAKAYAVESKRVFCLYCSKAHHTQKCFKFDKLSVSEKDKFVLGKKLCRGCLSTGHIYKKCRNKAKCNTCQGNHPTCLHDSVQAFKERASVEGSNLQPNAPTFVPHRSNDSPTANSDSLNSSVQSHSYAASSTSGCLSSMIVPVYVSHQNSPRQERLVYALLDNQSDTSFILEDTREALGVSGPKVDLSLSTMFAEDCKITCRRLCGLMVRAYNSEQKIPLPSLYSRPVMPANRAHIPTASMAKKWSHLQFLKSKLMPIRDNVEIGLLIGYNCNRALIPREVVAAQNGPFAQRTDLGWGIVGLVDTSCNFGSGISHRVLAYETGLHKINHVAFRTQVKEVVSPREILKVLESDFKDVTQGVGLSGDDRQFLGIMKSNVRIDDDGHYVLPLPFKSNKGHLCNNRWVAKRRLDHLKSKFDRNPDFKEKYVSFMEDMFANQYAEKVAESDLDKIKWFLPHHGVLNKVKLRVVFDCSAKYKGKSINDCLLQGPDLNNSLLGVLMRFRKNPVAFSCDITKMYYRFRVPEADRFYMCFLWWDEGDTSKEPCVYAMRVHTFGLKSSPSCCVFGLQQAADDLESEFGSDVANFLKQDFYVDDGLTSVETPSIAIDLITRTISLCERAKLRLHKFMSNSEEVLSFLPDDRKLVTPLDGVDLKFEELPIERALGVEWCVQKDAFQFRVELKQRPVTRRGLLATVAAMYDPLGFLSPFSLVGKRILQCLCIAGADWDDELPQDLRSLWLNWLSCIDSLKQVRVPRCVKPEGFEVQEIQFHHFCDASSSGYGCCSYLRLISKSGALHVTFIMGKSRVSPVKSITVPRLELSAAVLVVKMASVIESQMSYANAKHYYWCDSKVVLGYITNTSKRFHVFVTNRIGFIHSHSNVDQWRYVPGKINVADIASRGCTGEELIASKWFSGPDFLWKPGLPEFESKHFTVSKDDPEVKTVSTFVVAATQVFEVSRFEHISGWNRLKRVVAMILSLKTALKERRFSNNATVSKPSICESISASTLAEAEVELLRLAQSCYFSEEIQSLSLSRPVKLTSPISRLDCFLENGLIRVGGRLRHSSLSRFEVHPVVIPKNSHIGNLIIAFCHQRVFHQGKGMTLNEIRARGFWIVGCRLSVARHIYRCVICRRLRGGPVKQKMADLPGDRLKAGPPFTHCGVDLFGPFVVHEGRRELKRWGCIFTCLASRAVHLEVVNAVSTSSFINALRRFIAVRGPISLLRSDQGTNFVGADRELQSNFKQMAFTPEIKSFMLENNCVFEFKTNPPSASHMAGVWERLIRSVRNVLSTILFQHGSQLDDESLRTFLCEVSAVINSRPLTLENFSDPNFPEPLTPNHLLTMKTKLIVAPPGEFQREDVYSIKRWRRVQYLTNQFWSRWKSEYVHLLQHRSKWTRSRRNLSIGDIVVIVDETQPRNLWRVGRVCYVNVSTDGRVRSVKVTVGTRDLDKCGKRVSKLTCLERPVNKLVLLVEA